MSINCIILKILFGIDKEKILLYNINYRNIWEIDSYENKGN
ncbi:hypothetical protein HMPREF1871_00537 [Gemelliphila asaccharolytica]|uniref:Uncharacterized protein n=1 Tax=Gemelliphila asaccharolytica TaxID=502393 RepID=A0ABR5TN24_9BACL|nr:hypothetical protein HMPREF1871_00537 [Gemella asaccharolytica]